LIRAGADPVRAAAAVNVVARTWREWMARARGEVPKRPAGPELRDLARQVEWALGDAFAGTALRLNRTDPKAWLRRADAREEAERSREEAEHPPPSVPVVEHGLLDRVKAVKVMKILDKAGVLGDWREEAEVPGTLVDEGREQ